MRRTEPRSYLGLRRGPPRSENSPRFAGPDQATPRRGVRPQNGRSPPPVVAAATWVGAERRPSDERPHAPPRPTIDSPPTREPDRRASTRAVPPPPASRPPPDRVRRPKAPAPRCVQPRSRKDRCRTRVDTTLTAQGRVGKSSCVPGNDRYPLWQHPPGNAARAGRVQLSCWGFKLTARTDGVPGHRPTQAEVARRPELPRVRRPTRTSLLERLPPQVAGRDAGWHAQR